ncbi:MAG: hypothetical protein F4Y01_14760 [Gammaproteobacteria bacterium]|nr:hypothetical protein [Gammaproteobacteria bacterium]
MQMDEDKIDEAVLALLVLGIHGQQAGMLPRVWKSFDWDALDRLHEKGLISNPRSKAKSVVLTDDGLQQAEEAFARLFGGD